MALPRVAIAMALARAAGGALVASVSKDGAAKPAQVLTGAPGEDYDVRRSYMIIAGQPEDSPGVAEQIPVEGTPGEDAETSSDVEEDLPGEAAEREDVGEGNDVQLAKEGFFAKESNKYTKWCAMNMLEEVGDPEAVEALIEIMNDVGQELNFRESAAVHLSKIGRPEAVEALLEAAKDWIKTPLEWTARESIRDNVRDSRAIPILEAAARNTALPIKVRGDVSHALAAIHKVRGEVYHPLDELAEYMSLLAENPVANEKQKKGILKPPGKKPSLDKQVRFKE